MTAETEDELEKTAALDHAPLLERAFSRIPCDADYPLEPSQGVVPDYIRGSYYVNGPAGLERGAVRY
ncbi:MAG: hypothetical protein AAF657_39300, partial [Acidobacteriota bacterium]